jgi:hypothetical protein
MLLEMLTFLEKGYDSGNEDGNPQEEEDEQALDFVGRAQLAMILFVCFVAGFCLGGIQRMSSRQIRSDTIIVYARLEPHVLALLSPPPFHSKHRRNLF